MSDRDDSDEQGQEKTPARVWFELDALLVAVVSAVVALFRSECQHVLDRRLFYDTQLGAKGANYVILRCREPSDLDCAMAYCPRHCHIYCGCRGGDGDGGDEDEVEPTIAVTPPTKAQPRVIN